MATIDVPDLKFPEAPRWRDGSWWLSDQHGAVHRISEDGESSIVAELPHPSGLGFSPAGDLLVVTMEEPSLFRVTSDGPELIVDLTPHAQRCNDMYVDPRGRAYVGGYDEQYQAGRLLLVAPDGATSVVATDLDFPNGLAATPDGTTLIVAETFGRRLTGYDVADDGTLSNRRIWAALPGALPDGLCLDESGAAWVASYRAGEVLRVEEGGTVLERRHVTDRWLMACALGGADGRTLLLCTADTDLDRYRRGESTGYLETRRVDVPGVGRP